MKQAKGMIYATTGANGSGSPGSIQRSVNESPAQLGSLMLTGANQNGILQGTIGRSLSNERGSAWGPNNSMKV